MAKKKKELTEIEELDEFLQYDGYHDIYEELTDKDSKYFELFEPLEFCQVFSQAVEQIEQDKAKPLSVARHLKNELTLLHGEEPLTDEQRYFFYDKLLWWFENTRHDKQMDVCCREIKKLKENLDIEWKGVKTPEREFSFAKILKQLQTLPSYDKKIAYVLQEKTKYHQQVEIDLEMPNFGEKCELEIKKLKELKQLEERRKDAAEGVKKHNDLTLDRAALALNYLLTCAKVNCHNTEKAKFISFLTGYSEKQIAQKLSKLHKKEDENYVAYQRDMKVISQYFEKLGLREITSQIEKDLNI